MGKVGGWHEASKKTQRNSNKEWLSGLINTQGNTSIPRVVVYLFLILVLAGNLLFRFFTKESYIPNTNRLRYGSSAAIVDSIVTVPIAAEQALPLRKEELLAIRRQRAAQSQALLLDPYVPSQAVFGRVKDNTPWMSSEQFFTKGPSSDLQQTGPSFESRAVLNPFLLVTPVFWSFSIWDSVLPLSVKSSQLAQSPSMQPSLSSITYEDGLTHATATFDVSTFLAANLGKEVSELAGSAIPPIQISTNAYNARDLGFNHITFIPEASEHIQGNNNPPKDLPIADHLRYQGDACGNTEGCNHRWLNIRSQDRWQISSLPARMTFKVTRVETHNATQSILFELRFL